MNLSSALSKQYTEEQLLAFVEENLTRVLKAARLDKMYTALDDINKDFT